MAICSSKAVISIVWQAFSRRYIKIVLVLVLFLLSSISFAFGSDSYLHDFEDTDLTGWKDCGGSSWYIDPSTGHESKFSLRSGPIDCTGISRICREVDGPAEISFWWKCHPIRQGIVELTFTADDTIRVCDSTEWLPVSYTVRDNNTHQLGLGVQKDQVLSKEHGSWLD